VSYLGGLALLFIVVVGGIFGLYMIVGHATISAPVDTAGTTTGLAENNTRTVVETSATPIMYLAGAIALIVGFMLLIAAAIYLAGAKGSNFRSRY
jgi:hypothetical protein